MVKRMVWLKLYDQWFGGTIDSVAEGGTNNRLVEVKAEGTTIDNVAEGMAIVSWM